MSRSEIRATPPLVVWSVIVLAGIVILITSVLLPSKQKSEQTVVRNWLVQQAVANKNQRPVVLMLGTSLTGAGLDSASRLDDALYRVSGKDVQVLKVWKLDAGPNFFDALAPELIRLRPSVVVVEANILFYSFGRDKGWPQYVERFRHFLFRKTYDYEPDKKPMILTRQLSELEAFRKGLVDTSQLGGFRTLLDSLQRHGAKIVLLNFPLEAVLEKRKWSNADTASFFNNIQYLRRCCNVQYISEDSLLGAENFVDHAHMNAIGSSRQSKFFCEQVEKQLELP